MFCSQCGKEFEGYDKLCKDCSNASETSSTAVKRVALWNPKTAANWCFALTPIFGSFLHMLNWRALKEPKKFARSVTWFIGSILVVVYQIAMREAYAAGIVASPPSISILIVYFLAWYFIGARTQAKYVKDMLGDNYERKSWALIIAFYIMGAFFLVAVVHASMAWISG